MIMKDTPPEIEKKQREIFFQLSPHIRAKQAVDMINFGFFVLENSIKKQYKDISQKEMILEKIKRLYSNDFSKEEMERIQKHFSKI